MGHDKDASPYEAFIQGWKSAATMLAPVAAALPAAQLGATEPIAQGQVYRPGWPPAKSFLPGDAFRLLPPYLGTTVQGPVSFTSRCNRTTHVTAAPAAGGVNVTFTVAPAPGIVILCEDLYALGSPQGLDIVSVLTHGTSVHFVPLKSQVDQQWYSTFGVRVFGFLDDAVTTIGELITTAALYVPSETEGPALSPSTEPRLVAFLRDYVHNDLTPRGVNGQGINVTINPDEVVSGSTMIVLRLQGNACLEGFGTGAHSDHFVMAIRAQNGSLYVVESTDKTSYWPDHNVQVHDWDTWMSMAAAADYNLLLLPPSDATLAAFNHTAAWEYIDSMTGKPYGYHNFIFGFLDGDKTQNPKDLNYIAKNLPYPASWQLFEAVFQEVGNLAPAIAEKMWGLALGMRLGEGALTPTNASVLAWQRLGMHFGGLIGVPEQDDWVYPDGPARVCDSYVCSIYKAAGVFEALGVSDIQCTEMHNKDVYRLALFNTTASARPAACQQADPGLPYCQLMGRWTVTLTDVNSQAPYSSMDQYCAGLPPYFERAAGC